MCSLQKLARSCSAPSSCRRRARCHELVRSLSTFERALSSLWVAYQPIVQAHDGAEYGYEALVRTNEPAVPNPEVLFALAERFGRMRELGRRIRELVFEAAAKQPGTFLLFMNLHPYELLDEQLLVDVGRRPELARRTVLEVTERASLAKVPDAAARLQALREVGCRVAIDDLGAGYSGLSSFVELSPDLVKLDMSLVRDAHKSQVKQHIIRLLTEMCRQMGLSIVAEGIESNEERDIVVSLGCDLLQGYRFGRPGPGFLPPTW